VGQNDGSIVTSYSTGTVSGGWYFSGFVGGLVGQNNGSITSSFSTSDVTGDERVGGLVGHNSGSITTSYSTGTVKGDDYIGGLVGCNSGGSIVMSSSTGVVTGNGSVGGLVGRNYYDGSITTSYSSGTVTGGEHVGGLVGRNNGIVATSYSTGTVSGNSDVGGLVGNNSYGEVMDSFWDIQTSGQSISAGGTGKTTAEMQTGSTFLVAGWDFIDEVLNGTCDYWQILPDDYPQLCYHDGNSPVMPDGLGTGEQPYLIQNARDLGTVWFEPSAYYRLEAPVDLSGITWSIAVVPWFDGIFDGNGYVISNLHIQGGRYVGLFGQLDSGAEISNLGLEAVEVNGTDYYVGGLVGRNYDSIAMSCNTGTVSGDESIGGLVGDGLPSYVTACFWDIETSGLSSSDGGTGKTTAEMKTATTFLEAGWDFMGETANGTEDIWWIDEGQDYPRLWCELIPEN